jgi:hypothetical protein
VDTLSVPAIRAGLQNLKRTPVVVVRVEVLM